MPAYIENISVLEELIWRKVHETPAIDAYTNLYDLRFGENGFVWGLDNLLTSDQLVAEFFRNAPRLPGASERLTRAGFTALDKSAQADLVWEYLFRRRSPLSEAARGVLTTLGLLNIDPNRRDLAAYREAFSHYELQPHLRRVLKIANLKAVVMNNDPLGDAEREVWSHDTSRTEPFLSSLGLDGLLSWEMSQPILQNQGFAVERELEKESYDGVIKFLEHWLQKTNAVYFSLSVNGGFDLFAKKNSTMRLLRKCILPFCERHRVPLALVIGAQYDSDSIGAAADASALVSVEELCASFPDNKFLVAALSSRNQRLLCGVAHRFTNLMPFGSAWNTPSVMQGTMKIGLELLGDSFIPHYSGAAVLEQLLYRWAHARWTLGKTLQQQYLDLHRTGWRVTEEEISRDVHNMLQGNFLRFIDSE
ncbi:MAG: hypothetical protein LBP75_02875 [Planctomycetota bacterium]|jgi:hypothetical protein|nr:hypothetical protein [Planctomycetota bacterium]